MSKRYHVMALIMAVTLVFTAFSCGGQVMDGEDMVRSYTQISREEANRMMEQDGGDNYCIWNALKIEKKKQTRYDENSDYR